MIKKLEDVNYLAYSGNPSPTEQSITTALAAAVGNITPFANSRAANGVPTTMDHFKPLGKNAAVFPFLFTSVGCAVNALDACAEDLGVRVGDLHNHRILNSPIRVASGQKSVFEILNKHARGQLASRYDFGEIRPDMFNDSSIQKALQEDAPLFALAIGSILQGMQNAKGEQDRWSAMRVEQAKEFGIQTITASGKFHTPLDESSNHALIGGCISDLGSLCKAMGDAPKALEIWDGKTLGQVTSKEL